MTINGIQVVDSHVHLLPGRLGDKVRAFFDAGISSRGPLAYPHDHDAVVNTLAEEGVDEIWTLPYAHKPEIASGLNAASAATVQQFADGPLRIIGGATVHPGDDDAAEIVRVAVDDLGLRVLKLHCSVGSFSLDDKRLTPVFTLANDRRLPIVVHLGHNVNGRTEADELPTIAQISDEFPDIPLILAHCGHHSAPEAAALMMEHPSLYADLTPVVFEHPNIDRESLISLAPRLLFGSDAPNTGISVTNCLAWLEHMDIPQEQHVAILGKNARRLVENVVAK